MTQLDLSNILERHLEKKVFEENKLLKIQLRQLGQLEMETESSILQRFRELQTIDSKCSKLATFQIDVITQGTGWKNKGLNSGTQIAGSTTEGAMTARMFYPNQAYDNKYNERLSINREFEADVEYIMCEVPSEFEQKIEDVPFKPGYVKVLLDDELLSLFMEGRDRERTVNVVDDGYANSYKVKEALQRSLWYNDRLLHLVMAAALDMNPDEIELKRTVNKITKSSVANEVRLYIHGELKSTVSWDNILAIKCLWWPIVAKEWTTRKRNWPSQDVVSSLTTFCYVIPKPSDEEKDSKGSIEHRYSFAHIERKLAERRTQQQHLVYLIFKSMIYLWLKPNDPDHISSFIGKTVMCWVCEEYPPNHNMWAVSDASTIMAVSLLFKKLLEALDNEELPYYFIPEINVIKNVPTETKENAASIIRNIILPNIHEALPSNITEVIKVVKEMLDVVNKAIEFSMKYVENGAITFAHRPDLYPLIIKYFDRKRHHMIFKMEAGIQQNIDQLNTWLEEATENCVLHWSHDAKTLDAVAGDCGYNVELSNPASNFVNKIVTGLQQNNTADISRYLLENSQEMHNDCKAFFAELSEDPTLEVGSTSVNTINFALGGKTKVSLKVPDSVMPYYRKMEEILDNKVKIRRATRSLLDI